MGEPGDISLSVCIVCMCTWVEPSGRVVVVVESTGVLGYGKSVWFAARRNN